MIVIVANPLCLNWVSEGEMGHEAWDWDKAKIAGN